MGLLSGLGLLLGLHLVRARARARVRARARARAMARARVTVKVGARVGVSGCSLLRARVRRSCTRRSRLLLLVQQHVHAP